MTTRGVSLVAGSPPCASPNSASISSRTMRTTCWSGVRLRSTSWSTARSRTRSMNALTTLKLTSAFEQRHPDFPERQLDGLFGKPALSANVAENVLQPIGEGLEHDHPSALNV